MNRRRIAVVASHVIQYQDPFFRLLAGDLEIDLTVFYCSFTRTAGFSRDVSHYGPVIACVSAAIAAKALTHRW